MSLFDYERRGDADGLVEALSGSGNAEVRRRAAELLGGLEDPGDRRAVIDALVEAAATDERAVAAAAIDALDQLGADAIEVLVARMADREIDDGAPDSAKTEAFVDVLAADAPELRMAAANALGNLGRPEAVPDLIERLGDPDPRVRARAARACGEIADGRATEPLSERLADPRTAVRREAAEALGRIGSRGALGSLLECYDDEDAAVRRIAVAGMGAFGNDRPVGPVVSALGDPAASVRRAAVYSLLELLSSVPTEQSHDVREAVVAELSATDDPTVVERLAEVLAESTQPAQRRNAAWLLGRVVDEPGRAVVDPLVAALADDDPMTRQFAATSLATVGGDDVERKLLAVAEDADADADARERAVFALGTVGGADARRRLETIRETTDDEALAEAVAGALARLDGGS